MIKVKNRKVISKLSRKSMKANRGRNLLAIAAIVLTTMLFTTLLSIAGTLVKSMEQQNFRQVGGDAHGSFKYLSLEQAQKLEKDPLVLKSGKRLLLGMPTDAPFNKMHTELSYMDKTCAKGSFCTPEEGYFPKEGTKEIACDTRVLSLLGIKPELGAEVELTYHVGYGAEGEKVVTDTFILSGWWKFDEVSRSCQAIVPLSYCDEILADNESRMDSDIVGTWTLNVYFKNTRHIDSDLEKVARNSGETDVEYNANWAYLGAQMSSKMDPQTTLCVVALVVVFFLTGYLIIYNIFQISVTNEIHFYGLLKTIGTTAKQIRGLIYQQALYLSVIGIPIGLLFGFLCGNILAPVIMSNMTYHTTTTSTNPLIFLGSALFAMITVFISCRKPGRIAGKVSPIEASKYSDGMNGKRKEKRSSGKVTIGQMALSNISRNRKKTVFVILSLALATFLFQTVVTLSNSFNMDKFLSSLVATDYLVTNAGYFNHNGQSMEEIAVEKTTIDEIMKQPSFEVGGRIYGAAEQPMDFVDKDWLWDSKSYYMSEEDFNNYLRYQQQSEDGKYMESIHLYGMEELPLEQLMVIDGDLSVLNDPSKNGIVSIYTLDDYGQVEEESNWSKVGDQVTLRYATGWEMFDTRTDEVVLDYDAVDDTEYVGWRMTGYKDITYTVVATASILHTMSYRYYGSHEYVLGAEAFQQDTGTNNVMTYLFDVKNGMEPEMDAFLQDYTKNKEPMLDFDSKQKYEDQFDQYRNMFLLIGTVISVIVGLIGIINFMNAICTSIITRRHEFAMLQSIGMTVRQLRKMLITEGIWYAVISIALSIGISVITIPVMSKTIGGLFWFMEYRYQVLPFIIVTPIFLSLGIVIPYVAYRISSRKSIVEQLRTAE